MLIRILAVGLATVVSAGCAGPDVRPAADTLAKVGRIYVVPMESPPLEVSEWSFAMDPGKPGTLPPPPGGPPAAQGVAAGLFLLSQIPAKPDNVGELLKEAQSKLDALPAWNPAVDFSQEAARFLNASGRAATAISEVTALPKANADLLRGKELAGRLAWFNSDSPSTGYANLPGRENAVVAEISMRYSPLTADKLFIQVFVKLIDPKSGEIIVRTRKVPVYSQLPHLPPMNQALADEARQLKEIVTGAGNVLVRQCLQDLGFVSALADRK